MDTGWFHSWAIANSATVDVGVCLPGFLIRAEVVTLHVIFGNSECKELALSMWLCELISFSKMRQVMLLGLIYRWEHGSTETLRTEIATKASSQYVSESGFTLDPGLGLVFSLLITLTGYT
jgi:hypothetical protein